MSSTNNNLRIRAKTVIKLHTDSVTYDYTFNKDLPIQYVFKNLLHLVNDTATLDLIAAAVVERKERIVE